MSLGDYRCLVCDNGTGFVKVCAVSCSKGDKQDLANDEAGQVGYAGENFPRAIFPSMVGRPILRAEEVIPAAGCLMRSSRPGMTVVMLSVGLYHQAVDDTVQLRDVMCGDEAAAVRHCLEINYPVSASGRKC
jgi:actin-related protein 2